MDYHTGNKDIQNESHTFKIVNNTILKPSANMVRVYNYVWAYTSIYTYMLIQKSMILNQINGS